MEARLTGAYPYIRYTVSERLTIWSMFGFGNGEYTQKEEGIEKIETDISMRMGRSVSAVPSYRWLTR